MTNFSFVGSIRPMKDGFTKKSYDSGWINERCRFIVLAGANSHFVEVAAGKWEDDSKNVVYTMSKAVDGNKSEKIQVNWKDRKDPKIIDKVAGFRIMTVDLETKEDRTKARESGDEKMIEASNKKAHHFIANTDFCEFVNKLVNNEKIKDMKFRVAGNVTYSYSAKDGRYYSNYEVNKIYRVADDTPYSSFMSIPFYFGRDCINRDALESKGFVTLSGYTDYHDNFYNDNCFCPINLVLRKTGEALEHWAKKFNNFSSDDEDTAVKKIVLNCEKIHGSPMVNITLEDLSEEVREDIEFGLTTLEEIIQEMGQVKGDRVDEIRVEALGYGFRTNPAEDTNYTLIDMNRKPGSEMDQNDDKNQDDDSDVNIDDDDMFGDIDDDDDDLDI